MKKIIIRLYNHYNKTIKQSDTASLSYLLLLSIVPAITILFLVASFIDVDFKIVINILEIYFTNEMIDIFNEILDVGSKRIDIEITSIVVILSVLWASSKGMHSAKLVANKFYGVDYHAKNIVKERLISIFNTFLVIILIISFIMLFGVVPIVVQILKTNDQYLFLRLLLVFIIAFIVMLVLNYVIPSVRLSFKNIVVGSFFSAVMLCIFIIVFIKILQYWDYKNIYGPLALIVVSLIGLNFISVIIYLGFCINSLFYELDREHKLIVVYDKIEMRYLISKKVGKVFREL
jgi:Predicted membrane protein